MTAVSDQNDMMIKKLIPLDRDGRHVKFAKANHVVNTRFSEFLAGVLNKGVWWMP